jgi:glycosyltransferase involved in cell wall biosynthesis
MQAATTLVATMSRATVTVMMSTYNGEKYLRPQIESILDQDDVNVRLIVRDDGSTDGTIEIIKSYAKANKLEWYAGKHLGPANSFMDLVYSVDSEYGYFSFADQDDVWAKDKLAIALLELSKLDPKIPGLYFSTATLTNANLEILGVSPSYYPISSIAGVFSAPTLGCTMVFNKCLLLLVRSFSPQRVKMHDTWIHQVCYCVKGNIIIDSQSHLYYRQHSSNAAGGLGSLFQRFNNYLKIIKSKGTPISVVTVQELFDGFSNYIDEDTSRSLSRIACYNRNLISRFSFALSSLPYTENKKRNLATLILIVLGKW